MKDGQGNTMREKVSQEQVEGSVTLHLPLLRVTQKTKLTAITYMQRTPCSLLKPPCLLFLSLIFLEVPIYSALYIYLYGF